MAYAYIRSWFRPFRAQHEYGGATQGVALGYLLRPLQGRVSQAYQTDYRWGSHLTKPYSPDQT